MLSIDIEYFDAEKIMNSGQVFRMYRDEDGCFSVYSADRRLKFTQNGSRVSFFCDEKEFEEYWKHYFDLDRDYSVFVKAVLEEKQIGTEDTEMAEDDRRTVKDTGKADGSFLRAACEYGSGIRLLNQDIWEMMISFIISQQKQIPSIRKCIEALCRRFGEEKDGYFAFPKPEKIAAAGPEGVKGLSLGYRERYIYETAVAYLERGVSDEEFRNMDFEDARKYLCSFCGIGEKVANCICLFAGGFIDAFPIDVHIKDILYREYGDGSVPKDKMKPKDYCGLIEKNFGRYAGFKGIVQQWIFAYELVRK